MKRNWPYWLLPLLHFAVVVIAAFSVHYANGINVHGFAGDYSFWMFAGNVGSRAFKFTRWIVPVTLLIVLLRTREKNKEGACFLAAALGVLVATGPLYSGLIEFWERNWIPAI